MPWKSHIRWCLFMDLFVQECWVFSLQHYQFARLNYRASFAGVAWKTIIQTDYTPTKDQQTTMITPENARAAVLRRSNSHCSGTVDPWSCRLPESGEVFLQRRLGPSHWDPKKKPPRGRLGDSAICRGKRRSESRVAPNIYLRRASLTGHPKALCIVFDICICCLLQIWRMQHDAILNQCLWSKFKLCIHNLLVRIVYWN